MERRLPLVIAVFCVLLGIGVWLYRAQGTSAANRGPTPPGSTVVRNAWTLGRQVPLKGRQRIKMADPRNPGGIIEVTAEVLQSRDGHMRIEYLSEPLEGSRIWENSERTYRYNPKRSRLTVAQKQGTAQEQVERELALLEKNYTAAVVGTDQTAERPVWVVELKPVHPLDRWKRLAVDQEKWTILENEDIGAQGLLRRTRFIEVEYLDPTAALPANEFQPPASLLAKAEGAPEGSARFTDLTALTRLVGFRVRAPQELPKGFVFHGAYQVSCICGLDHRAVRLEYSDGLNHISLFEAGHPECTAPKGKFKGPAPLAVNLTRNGVYYWAYGALPREELKALLENTARS